jgi:putative Mn2+ efflux pump MntP
MELFTLFAIALGLSFDTFAVSLSYGVVQAQISFRQALKVAFVMAVFQGGFPLAGYYLGYTFSEYVEPIDHWIAFGLLLLLGIKMISEGLWSSTPVETRDFTRLYILITMGVSTSIDAFVVGIGLGFLDANIWVSAIIIGIVTFIASMIAIRLGKGVGLKFGSRVEVAGGIILILIGLKILLEHLVLAAG